MGMAFLSSVGISAIILVFGQYILKLFTADPSVADIGMQIIRLLVPYYFTYVGIEVLSGTVRGAGDAFIPMVMTCVGVCVLRVAWIFIAVPLNRQISTVILSYPITWIITSVLFIIYYIHGGWLRRRKARMGFSD